MPDTPTNAPLSGRMELRSLRLALAVLLVIAFGLRAWGAWFDLPELSHPDEHHEVHRALRLGLGNIEWDRVGKGGYFYVLFVEYGVYFVVLRMAGIIDSVNEFMTFYLRDSSSFWLIGRLTTALLGTLNVWITYRIGRKVAGTGVGLLAAGFLTFCSLDVMHSKFITVDIPQTTCILATVFFALRIVEHGKLSNYLLAGACAALATMTKLSSAPVVVTIALAHGMNVAGGPGWARRFISDKRIYWAALVCAVVYAVGQPSVVVMPFKLTGAVRDVTLGREQPQWGTRPFLPLYYAQVGVRSLGWPLAVASLVAAVWSCLRRRKEDLLLLSYPALLACFLLATQSDWRNARYLLPMIPLLLVAVSQLVVTAATTKLGRQAATTVIAGIFVVVCVPRLVVIVRDNVTYSRPSTSLLAKAWIEENVPEGTAIQLLGWPGVRHERKLCPLNDLPENMRRFADELEAESPMGARFVRLTADLDQRPAYNLEVVRHADQWPSLREIRRAGIRYVVVPVHTFTIEFDAESKGRKSFYESLQQDSSAKLCASFQAERQILVPLDSMRRDVTMEIYDLGTAVLAER